VSDQPFRELGQKMKLGFNGHDATAAECCGATCIVVGVRGALIYDLRISFSRTTRSCGSFLLLIRYLTAARRQ
jgi:hypothetical protein